MKSLALILVTICIVILESNHVEAKINDRCDGDRHCGKNEICYNGRCRCGPDTITWHGNICKKRKSHGDDCEDQIDCSASGDSRLHCLVDSSGQKKCMCEDSHEAQRGDDGKLWCKRKIFYVNKLSDSKTKGATGGWIFPVSDNQHDQQYKDVKSIHHLIKGHEDRDARHSHETTKDSKLAPIILCMFAALLIVLCCLFCRIDPSAPHSADVERERQRKYIAESAQMEGNPPDLELANGNGAYVNAGLELDPDDENADSVSRFTALTEISEASHADYINDESGSRNGDVANGKPKDRTKIRTNPHVNGSTLEKKAKKARHEKDKDNNNKGQQGKKKRKKSLPTGESKVVKDKKTKDVAEKNNNNNQEKAKESTDEVDKDPSNPFSENYDDDKPESDRNHNNDQNESDDVESDQDKKKIFSIGDGQDELEVEEPRNQDDTEEVHVTIQEEEEEPKPTPKSSVESQISQQRPPAIRPNIERVDTDDCTSIDTTIPQDEVLIDPANLSSLQRPNFPPGNDAKPGERFIY